MGAVPVHEVFFGSALTLLYAHKMKKAGSFFNETGLYVL